MPKITLENGKVVNISQESYDELERAIAKDWRDAVDEFKFGFAKRTNVSNVIYGQDNSNCARMYMTNNQIRSLRDKAIIIWSLQEGGIVSFEKDKAFFRPDPRRASYRQAVEGIKTWYDVLKSEASEDELRRNKLI